MTDYPEIGTLAAFQSLVRRKSSACEFKWGDGNEWSRAGKARDSGILCMPIYTPVGIRTDIPA